MTEKPVPADAPAKSLLAAAPLDRRMQAAGMIAFGMLAAVWVRKATR